LSHGKHIVGGLYFGRHPAGRAMYYEALRDTPEGAAENARAHKAPFNELKPVRWVATGGILIHRQVFLDIQENFPHLAPTFPGGEPFHFFTNASDGAMHRMTAVEDLVKAADQSARAERVDEAKAHLADAVRLLTEAKSDTKRNSNLQQGEDQTFGIRAGQVGHQSYVDLGLVYGHIGTAVYGPHNTNAPSAKHTYQ
jgi:hypothetical protein